MMIKTNQNIYTNDEFDQWVNRSSLLPSEQYIIDKYLNKEGKAVEAGTAGGRILLEMKQQGFSSLYGFDFVSSFIEEATVKDIDRKINWSVQNATNLNYESNFFDQILYLQQIICLIENSSDRDSAMKEAYRILKPGGIALFSFLNFEDRYNNFAYRIFLEYIRLFRLFGGNKSSLQYQPWLKLGGKWNLSAILDSQPYVYWYNVREILALLESYGFKPMFVGSDKQVELGKSFCTPNELSDLEKQGYLYCICQK
jgi:SAM-dependent methyltransferase